MILGALRASLLGNLLTCKGVLREGEQVICGDERVIQAVQDLQCYLIL